jgi:hypothetical protein
MLEHMPERMREALLTFPEVSAVKKFCVGDRLFFYSGKLVKLAVQGWLLSHRVPLVSRQGVDRNDGAILTAFVPISWLSAFLLF